MEISEDTYQVIYKGTDKMKIDPTKSKKSFYVYFLINPTQANLFFISIVIKKTNFVKIFILLKSYQSKLLFIKFL